MSDRPHLDHVGPVTCAQFDEAAPELALGVLDAGAADALVRHADTCDRCRAELDTLSGVADRLSTIAPEAEPPVGFEQRALSSMTRSVTPARSRVVAGRIRIVAAAAAVLLVVAAVVAVASLRDDRRLAALDRVGVTSLRSGRLVDAGGRGRGTALLATTTSDDPVVTLTMRLSDVEPGTYRCSVVTRSGQRIEVAAWPVRADGAGMWVVPLRGAAASASAVVIEEDGRSEVATAELR